MPAAFVGDSAHRAPDSRLCTVHVPARTRLVCTRPSDHSGDGAAARTARPGCFLWHCHVGECGRPGSIRAVPTATRPYEGHRCPVEIINHCVWLYFRFPLTFREVEE